MTGLTPTEIGTCAACAMNATSLSEAASAQINRFLIEFVRDEPADNVPYVVVFEADQRLDELRGVLRMLLNILAKALPTNSAPPSQKH